LTTALPRPPADVGTLVCAAAQASLRRLVDALPPVEPNEEERANRHTLLDADAAFHTCHTTPHGTWSLELTALGRTEEGSSEWRGRWALVFTNPAGQRRVTQPAPDAHDEALVAGFNLMLSNYVSIYPSQAVAWDYDGDGAPEFVTVLRTRRHEAPSFSVAQVWTVRDGQIVPYPPAAHLAATEVEDGDHDGRPDLVTHLGYASLSGSRGSGFEYNFLGPRFLAHATTRGEFSTDDAAARDFARQACAPLRGSIVVEHTDLSGHPVDDRSTAHAIVCARMYGTDADAIVPVVQRACAPRDPSPEAEPRCDNVELLEDWARRPPPFRLDVP